MPYRYMSGMESQQLLDAAAAKPTGKSAESFLDLAELHLAVLLVPVVIGLYLAVQFKTTTGQAESD